MKLLCEGALAVARDVVSANLRRHTDLSAQLRQEERVEGAALQVGGWVGWAGSSHTRCFCLLLPAVFVFGGFRQPLLAFAWPLSLPTSLAPPPPMYATAAAAGVAGGHRGAAVAQGLRAARRDARGRRQARARRRRRRHLRCRHACGVIILAAGCPQLALVSDRASHMYISFHCNPHVHSTFRCGPL